MILQRGTTGFQHFKDPQLPLVDLRAFRTVFHAVAQGLSAKVIHNPRRNPDAECSFADALLQVEDDRVVVLLNCFHPLIAFASETTAGYPPEFRNNHADLAQAFSVYPNFTVLSVATLTESPTAGMMSNLAPAEMEQFNYWKPPRIGDVIFNYWD